MEPQEKMTSQQFIIDRLRDIQRKVEASNYTEALSYMKEMKAADTKNIYIIALEKQITKLKDATLPADERTEITKSLPAMIDRAITDAQRRTQVTKPEEEQKGQKKVALEKLKSQYFQRADDYVKKQEYQRALEEIRRIYIIEPGSVVANEYEQKIEQLASLHARGEVQPEPAKETKETEVTASQASEPSKEKYQSGEAPKKSNLPIIIAAAVIILAVGGWFLFSHGSGSTKKEQVSEQPAISPQENENPALATTTTATPQGAEPAGGTAKQPIKTQKPAPEIKVAAPVQKPAQQVSAQPPKTPASTPQVQQQQQTAAQPAVAASPAQTSPEQQPKTAESTPAPMPFVAIESQPEPIHKELPVYPDIAVKMGIQGKVVVEATVDAQGKPIQAKVVKSSSEIFNDAAIDAVMKYVFKPAMMSTGPVTAKVYIPIDFRMKR